MRLIDADALIAHINECIDVQNDNWEYERAEGLKIALKCISDAPTIKSERKKGRWINEHWDGDYRFQTDGRGNCWKVVECSVCNVEKKGSPTNFCPCCGADMRGEADDN